MSRARPFLTRSESLDRLSSRTFDLLIIGGGITGAGVALDAATRGLSVALIERNDFASGTSSKSTKLIHGGIRYLEQKEFGLMRENTHERDLLRRLAPNLVRPLPFFWPRWAGAGAKASVGLWIYDFLAGVRNVHRHERTSQKDAAEQIPHTRKSTGGYTFYDCGTDDVRLTLAILKAAQLAGAVVCNHVEALELHEVSGAVVGCLARETLIGEDIRVRANDVVSATGVWADYLRIAEDARAESKLRPSKGIHILVSQKTLPLKSALIFPSVEKRLIFAVPWRSSVIIGTTDTDYSGSLDEPSVTEEDAALLLDSLSTTFELEIGPEHVVGAYAGLRPLLADAKTETTRDLSRRHAIFRGPKGLVTVTGGKLTTYRAMAEDVVDLITRRQGRFPKCVTKSVRLGVTSLARTSEQTREATTALGLEPAVAESLVFAYGDDAPEILAIAREEGLAYPLVEGLPYIAGEVAWAVRSEMSATPSDILSRRIRTSLEDPAAGMNERSKALIEAELQTVNGQFEIFLSDIHRERGPLAGRVREGTG